MKRKIFISINLPERSKRRLTKAVAPWQNLPIKWVREDNLHITLSFLGFVSDDALVDICDQIRKAVFKSEIFDLDLSEISLAPNPQNPKMIWLTGDANEELRILQENIEIGLGVFVSSKKSFAPHITLGRIRAHKWEALDAKPEIFQKFPLVVGVSSVEIMASDFAEDGPEFTIIETCPLS